MMRRILQKEKVYFTMLALAAHIDYDVQESINVLFIFILFTLVFI